MANKDQEPIFVVGVIGRIADTIITICLIILGAALPLLFLWVTYLEASTWLATGNWAAVSFATLMEPTTTELMGLQKILDVLYSLSVLIPLAIGSVVMWAVCVYLADYSFGDRK